MLDATTTVPGSKVVSWGSGKRMDEEQADEKEKQCHSVIPIKIIDDRAIVFYSQESPKPEERFTLYALLARLALDGKGKVKVNYHTMGVPEKPESASIGRFSISPNRNKMWLCMKPQWEPAPGSSENIPAKQTVMWHQLLRFLPPTNLKKKFFQEAWDVKLESPSGQHFISFERPILVWSQVLQFQKDPWFRSG